MTELKFEVHNGNNRMILPYIPNNSIDSLVTDPPAGIAFMGHGWDEDKGGRNQWIKWLQVVAKECLRAMKPGAYGIVWTLPRTCHWTLYAFENAGFEVVDLVNHVFGLGFPKGLDISKALDKVAGHDRQEKVEVEKGRFKDISKPITHIAKKLEGWRTTLKPCNETWILVRKPSAEPSAKDITGTTRFFYCPKVSVADREFGLDDFTEEGEKAKFLRTLGNRSTRKFKNTHPTVKSTRLMDYLIELVTPHNGVVLDPFMGSGSTGVAALKYGFNFVGIEKETKYFEIARSRIAAAKDEYHNRT
jgi:site-specific DNA-methyltransferase (adenine-specific)